MKNRIGRIIRFETAYAGHELFLCAGLLMVFLVLIKLLGFADFSSDWFWFVAGLGLIVEGLIMIARQKKFNKKYKVIERIPEGSQEGKI